MSGRRVILIILFVCAVGFFVWRNWPVHQLLRCNTIDCWREHIAEVTTRHGLSVAFAYLDKLRLENDLFRANCHVFAHAIGEAGYQVFSRDGAIRAHVSMESCGFGFYHGFMQEFIAHGSPAIRAQALCDQFNAELSGRSDLVNNTTQQCYHGIGHGIVYAAVADHGLNEVPLIAGSLKQCEEMFDDPYECANGVFGGIALMYFGVHGFYIEPRHDDPFWVCQPQAYEYQLRCYDQLVPVVYSLYGERIDQAAPVISLIPDEHIARVAMAHLGTMPLHKIPLQTLEDVNRVSAEIFSSCRAAGKLFSSCAQGYVLSLVYIQLRPQGAMWGRHVCETMLSDMLDECMQTVMGQLVYSYPDKEAHAFCRSLPENFMIKCIEVIEGRSV